MRRSRLSLYAAFIHLASSPTSAISLHHYLFLERASGCSNAADIPCNQGLPSNFCCGSATVCLSLAGNTTALCCPTGQSCNQIQTVSCDIQLQNVTAFPENALLTTDLSGTLPVCGNQCCPFGYTCGTGNTSCVENKNQELPPGETAAPSSSSTSSSAPPSSSTSNSPSPTTRPISSTAPVSTVIGTTSSAIGPTSATGKPTKSTVSSSSPSETDPLTVPDSAASSSTETTPVAKPSAFPADVVLAGFFPGMVAGILLSVAIFCFLGSRRRKLEARRNSGTSSFTNRPLGPSVSGPIYDPASNVRTDFLRRHNPTDSSNNSRFARPPTLKRVTNFMRKSMHMNNSGVAHTNTNPITTIPRRAPVPPMTSAPPRTMLPQTLKGQRAESGVSISVFADSDISTPPNGTSPPAPLNLSKQTVPKRGSHVTTFDDFMDAANSERADLAGLKKGEPFVQQPVGHYTHERKGSNGRNLMLRKNEGI